MPSQGSRYAIVGGVIGLILALTAAGQGADSPAPVTQQIGPDAATSQTEYYRQMSVPQPFLVCAGQAWETHWRQLQDYLLDCTGLQPLPEWVPQDVPIAAARAALAGRTVSVTPSPPPSRSGFPA